MRIVHVAFILLDLTAIYIILALEILHIVVGVLHLVRRHHGRFGSISIILLIVCAEIEEEWQKAVAVALIFGLREHVLRLMRIDLQVLSLPHVYAVRVEVVIRVEGHGDLAVVLTHRLPIEPVHRAITDITVVLPRTARIELRVVPPLI